MHKTIQRHLLSAILCLFVLPLYSQQGMANYPVFQNNTEINSRFTHTFQQRELVKMYDTVRLAFIGDVMQHGTQVKNALIKDKDPNNSQSYDFSSAFKYTSRLLKKADIAVANMEFPMAGPPFQGYPLFSAPSAMAWEAQRSGINVFLLANNHLLDMGKQGFEKTIAVYTNMEGKYTGAYLSPEEEERDNPLLFDVNGIKIALINFTYGTNGFSVPAPYKMNLMDSIHVKEVIKRAKERGAEFIIALPHWGEEYQLLPSEKQRAWGKMLFREGVKAIIGSHPHVPQVAEIYYKEKQIPLQKGEKKIPISNKEVEKLIFYSLGNYISNQSIPDYSQLELLVELTLVKDNFTNKIIILPPKHHFLWCFRKNEFERDFTVVPIEDFIGKEDVIQNKAQYRRMMNTHQYILEKRLIKEIY